MTAPTVALAINVPVDGVFVLDTSVLGAGDHLAGPGEAGLIWQTVTDEATNITTRRGGRRDGLNTTIEVGTLAATFINGIDFTVDFDTYRPGRPVRLIETTTAEVLFMGTVEDIFGTVNKKGDTVVTLVAHDAVSTYANTTRYGLANPHLEGEPWTARVARLMVAAPVPFVAPTTELAGDNLLDHNGAVEVGLWSGGTHNASPGNPWSFMLGVLTRPITGLTVEHYYQVTVDVVEQPQIVTLSILGNTSGFGTILPDDVVRYTVGFTATATTEILTLNTNSGFQTLVTFRIDHTFPVSWAANNVYETNIAKHLDVATASAGTGWFIDRNGIARIAPPAPTIALHAADVSDPGDPLNVSYTDAAIVFNTATTVNDLAFNNHARAWDEASADWRADDTALGPFTNALSAVVWSTRSATVETSIYSGPDYPYNDLATRLATAILAAHSAPAVTITAVTFDTMPNAALIAALDLYSRITATRLTVTNDVTIIAITHTITPRSWATTLDLQEA